MQRGGRRRVLLEKTAQVFELPADVVAGVPRMEIVGDGEFRMENHRGILSCAEDEILISAGAWLVKLTGSGLEVRVMTGLEVLVTGKLLRVELT